MSSRFLIGSSGDLTSLQDGSFAANVASLILQNVTPNMPVKTDAARQLVTGFIQLADCNFVPITNPVSANIDMADYSITDLRESLYTNNTTPSTPAMDMINVFANNDRLCYRDDTATSYVLATQSELGNYLPLTGGTMTGTINMGYQNITNSNNITCNQLNYTTLNPPISGVFLPLAGGTMSGTINMGAQEITNVSAVRFNNTNVTLGASSTIGAGTTNNINIGNATTIPTASDSNVVIGNQASMSGLGTAGNIVLGYLASSVLGGYNTVIGQQASGRGNAVAIGKEVVAGAGATIVGHRSWSNTHIDSVVMGRDNTSSAASADIFGVNRTNNQINSLLLGNGSYQNIRANSTCDLGTVAAPFQSLYINGSIAGTTKTSAANDLVTNAGLATAGRVATFSANKIIQDGGTLLSDLATTSSMNSAIAAAVALRVAKAGDTMTGTLAMGANAITGTGAISAGTFAAVTSATTPIIINAFTDADKIQFLGSTNAAKTAHTTGWNIANYSGALTGTGAGGPNLGTFSWNTVDAAGTGWKSIATLANSGNFAVTGSINAVGATLTGALAMGANNITSSGSLVGPTWTRTVDNIVSLPGVQTYGNIAMMSASTKVLEDSGVSSFSVVTGPASAVNNNVALFNGITGKVIQTGAAAIGTLGALTLANTTASTTTGTGALICAGGVGIGGAVNVGGAIKTTNATASTSTSTGAIISTGGIGVAGAAYIGGATFITGNVGIGTTTANAAIQLANTITNRRVVLWETTNNDHQFYGLGINASTLRYQIDSIAATNSHAFYAGASTVASNELMRITGPGHLLVGTTTASARIVASGGVQNVASEDTCIRAISSSNATKIELQCTSGTGRLYELRSLNNGSFDIVDRTGGVGRLTLDTLGNMGIAMIPTAGGNNGIFIGNGAGPTVIPATGGALYVAAGRLFYRGSAGTVTLLAPA